MLTSGQKPAPCAGRMCASSTAERAPHHEQRREHAAEVPEPSETDQMVALTIISGTIMSTPAAAEQQRLDLVVPDAERLRADEPADADDQAAQRRPPHPVHACSLPKGVLGGVDGGGEQRREHAGGEPDEACS